MRTIYISIGTIPPILNIIVHITFELITCTFVSHWIQASYITISNSKLKWWETVKVDQPSTMVSNSWTLLSPCQKYCKALAHVVSTMQKQHCQFQLRECWQNTPMSTIWHQDRKIRNTESCRRDNRQHNEWSMGRQYFYSHNFLLDWKYFVLQNE